MPKRECDCYCGCPKCDVPHKQPHKHAAVIKAWADGAIVQVHTDDEGWKDVANPVWADRAHYRVKPHKWQKEMDAYAAGKTIQFRTSPTSPWMELLTYEFDSKFGEHRIKPEQVVREARMFLDENRNQALAVIPYPNTPRPNVRFTFEDGLPVKMEIINGNS